MIPYLLDGKMILASDPFGHTDISPDTYSGAHYRAVTSTGTSSEKIHHSNISIAYWL
jgi:hypothetical protein